MTAEHGRHNEGHQERHERVHADLETARIQRLEEAKVESAQERDDRQERVEQAREAILGPKKVEQEAKPQEVEHESHKEKAETPDSEEQILSEPKISLPMLSPTLNYVHTMKSLRRQMEPMSRNFSKFIHMPVIEKTSEFLETTVARPSIAVGATWTALIVGTVFYLVDRHYGYNQSGSELLFSFIVGAFVGLLIEGLVFMFRRRP